MRVLVSGACGGLGSRVTELLAAAGDTVFAADVDRRALSQMKGLPRAFPLLARPGGRVVLVSSEAARCSMPFNGPYTISKCALEAYADVLRRELMLLGVAVSVVQPGAFRTRLLEDAAEAFTDRAAGTLFSAHLARVRELVGREWERGMDAGEVARVVVRAVHARTPRALYRIGNDPLRVLLGRIPAWWTDRLIERFGGA